MPILPATDCAWLWALYTTYVYYYIAMNLSFTSNHLSILIAILPNRWRGVPRFWCTSSCETSVTFTSVPCWKRPIFLQKSPWSCHTLYLRIGQLLIGVYYSWNNSFTILCLYLRIVRSTWHDFNLQYIKIFFKAAK